jgi:hypothetical protein
MTRRAEIYMKTFRHGTKANLLKSWPPGVGWGHNRGNFFLYVFILENIFKIFSGTIGPEKLKFI